MGTRATIELDYFGEITYLACVVYVLCFGGLVLVCRSVLSGKRNNSSKHIDKTKENEGDIKSKQMGGILSKKGNSKSFDVTTPPATKHGRKEDDSIDESPRSLKQRNKVKHKDNSKSKKNKNNGDLTTTNAQQKRGKRNNNPNKEQQTPSFSSSDYTKAKEERNVMTKSFSTDVVSQEKRTQIDHNKELKSTKAVSEGNIHRLTESTKFSTEIFDSLSDYFVQPSNAMTAITTENDTLKKQKELKQRASTFDAIPLNEDTKQNSVEIPHEVDVNLNKKKFHSSETSTPVDNKPQTVSEDKTGCEALTTDNTKTDITQVDNSTAIKKEKVLTNRVKINKVDPPLRERAEIEVYALRLSCNIMEQLYRNIKNELDQFERAKRNRLRFAKDLANSTVNDSTMAQFFPETNEMDKLNLGCNDEENNDPLEKTNDSGCHPRIDLYADVVTHRVLNQIRDLPSLENFASKIVDNACNAALTDLSNQRKENSDTPDSPPQINLTVPEHNSINRRQSGSSDDEAITNIRLRQSQKSTLERRPLSTYAEKLIDFLDDDDDEDLSDLSTDEEDSVNDDDDDDNDDDGSQPVDVPLKVIIPSPKIKETRAGVCNEERINDYDSDRSSCYSQGLTTPVTPLSPPFQQGWKSGSPRRSVSGSSFRSRLSSSVGVDGIVPAMPLKQTLVIDFGCGEIRAGLAGQRAPDCIFPSLIGVPRRFSQHIGSEVKPTCFGHSAITSSARLQLDHPLKTDGMTDWNSIFYLLEYTLEELDVIACERPLLISCCAEEDARQREKLTEIIFERLNSPGFYLANQSVLTLMSMGLKSGICLSSGYSSTTCSQIYEGSVVKHNVQTLDIGGEEITNHFGRLIMANGGQVFSSSSERLILESMKKSCAYISTDHANELTVLGQKSEKYIPYTLPDGQVIEIGPERFDCSEILFNPSEIGLTQLSMPQMVSSCILRADKDDRMELIRNIVVTGGATQLEGFLPRLTKELNMDTLLKGQHRLLTPNDPNLAAWMGGSMFASLPSFESLCMSIDDYEEGGAKMINRYCF